MKAILTGTLLALATTTAGAAEMDYMTAHSANNILPNCKIFIDETASTQAATVDTASKYFYCSGVIDTLVLLSPALRAPATCFQLPDRRYDRASRESHHPLHRGTSSENARNF